ITKYNFLIKKGQTVMIKLNNTLSLDIIYEDKDIIVVNKPYGLLSISTNNENDETMYRKVSDYIKKDDPHNKIFVIHRLDKETSGLIMFAKNAKIKELLQASWNELVIKRTYLAIVEGKLESGTIKSYLKENKALMVYSTNNTSEGKLAITNYKMLKQSTNYTWLEVEIETGRKNQIRVHMSDLGHPIVGDMKYGSKTNPYNRLCLHAYSLIITNPYTKKPMKFIAKPIDIFR
ncbi:MAG: RNA pseudouridine synthase, partial [Bacilli bacterium]